MPMPTWLRRLRARWRYRHFQEDVAREIETHRAMTQSALEQSGVEKDAARTQAARTLGNVTLMREEARSVWIAAWLESLWQDVRYAFRLLRRQPGFTAAVVAILALGSALVTVLFTAGYGLFYRPWPVPDPDRVVMLRARPATTVREYGSIQIAEFRYLEAQTTTLSPLALMSRSYTGSLTYRGERRAEARLINVSRGYFDLLGSTIVAGRGFTADEFDYTRPAAVAILSRSLWRQLGDDPAILGQTIDISRMRLTVVGVSSAENFVEITGSRYDLALPLPAQALGGTAEDLAMFTDPRRRSAVLSLAGRLKPGVSQAAAAAELTTLAQQFRTAEQLPPITVTVFDTRPINGPYRASSFEIARLILLALVLVQVLACANVGNLLLARGLSRGREMAIRQAIGAGRPRLIRQLLIEAGVLAVAAGSIGLALAFAVGPIMGAIGGGEVRAEAFAPDAPVLLFCLGLALWTTLVAGLAPALRVTRRRLTPALGERSGPGPDSLRLRRLLLGTQIALATVLLAGAGLLTRAVSHASSSDPGFALRELRAIDIRLPQGSLSRTEAFFRDLRPALALSDLPPIAFTEQAPLTDSRVVNYLRRQDDTSGSPMAFRRNGVSPNYFEVTGVPLVTGRAPAAYEQKELVISEAVARHFWPGGESPIGKVLLSGFTTRELQPLTIVGVARDVSVNSIAEPEPSVYQGAQYGRVTGLVRDLSPAIVERVRTVAASVDPTATVRGYPLSDNIRASLSTAILGGRIAWGIGALGLLLATIGAFGVFAYAVEERRREIGIRLALGARRAHVIRAVWSTSQRAMVFGLVAGGVLAAGGAQLLRRFLHGLSPFDPLAYAQIALILIAAGALATWLPARRAARVDPAVTLKAE